MTLKEQLLQEIEQAPDALVPQLLDFFLFLKERHSETEITKEEEANILGSLQDYQAGHYLTLEEKDSSYFAKND
ncbi:MAG: DUF2281 domain-containing protein [Merismopediaceae bacterium]|nr:DUF2281 domain-containing protein [Merismopediaceae bacterium]